MNSAVKENASLTELLAVEETAPFQHFKARQREIWAGFGANEGFTTFAAGDRVAFAKVRTGETVLDVGCGTGVDAVTAARAGATAIPDGARLLAALASGWHALASFAVSFVFIGLFWAAHHNRLRYVWRATHVFLQNHRVSVRNQGVMSR